MYFKQVLDELSGCASYLIASRQSLEAAVIDPGMEIQQYEELLRERDFRLSYIIDTHIHADHVSGARRLLERHPEAVFYMHRDAEVSYPFQPLDGGEELPLGQLRLRILHTPGHRKELISVLVINPPRSPEPSMIMTGDSLLVGDVGRPDFGSGDAGSQYDSMQRLLELPDWVAVFPGHFEGPCARGMCGRPSTTIGFERRFNPMLQLERETFVENLTGEVPARPLNMTAIEATNRGTAEKGWAMPRRSMPVDEVSVDHVVSSGSRLLLLDVREPDEYAEGHIPGSISVPQAEVADHMNQFSREKPIVAICHSGMRSSQVAQFLKEQGHRDVSNLAGGMLAWEAAEQPLATSDGPKSNRRIVETQWTHAGVREMQEKPGEG